MSAYNRGYRAHRFSPKENRREQRAEDNAISDEDSPEYQEAVRDLREYKMKQDSLPLKEKPIKSLGGSGEVSRGDQSEVSQMTHTPPTQNKETTVAATPNVPTTEAKARELSRPFEPQSLKFATAIADLLKRPLTRQTVEIAKEFDVEAIKYLDDIKRSELRRQADSAFSLHRFLTGIISKLSTPAESLRRTCSDVIVRFDRQERVRALEEQREREAAIRKQQEEERAEELKALEADGKAEEAAVLKEEPLAPVVSPAPREATKIENVSLVYSANVDPEAPITDTKAFGAWLAEHHEHLRGMEFKASYWKSMLSAHLNKQNGSMSIEIPGLSVKVSGSSRHRAGE